MTITLGINGFGRIGRCTLMHIAESARQDVRVVKLNATGPLETAAHLVRYDSVHGRFGNPVTTGEGWMELGAGKIEMMSTYDMDELDWSGVDVVLECTGFFADRDLYLLRNQSRGNGVGFFDAGNFYADFILWLLDGNIQHIAPYMLFRVPFLMPVYGAGLKAKAQLAS